jgi:hypothetical protein
MTGTRCIWSYDEGLWWCRLICTQVHLYAHDLRPAGSCISMYDHAVFCARGRMVSLARFPCHLTDLHFFLYLFNFLLGLEVSRTYCTLHVSQIISVCAQAARQGKYLQPQGGPIVLSVPNLCPQNVRPAWTALSLD